MKKSKYSFLLICLFLLTIKSLALDSLEVIMTFEMPEDSVRFLPQQGGDYNNDGYDDLLYTYYNRFSGETKLQFYFGSSEPSPVPDYDYEIDIGFIGQPGWLGDLNKDGYKDITLSVTDGWPYCCDIYIYFGNKTYTIDPDLPDMILYGIHYSGGAHYAGGNRNADFNGDGYADILAGGTGPEMVFNGQVDIFFGGKEIDTLRDFHIEGGIGDELGLYKAIGDINGDGCDDLIVSRNMQQFEGLFKYEIYLGGINMDTNKDYELPDIWLDTKSPQANGDINNDGYNDFIISGGIDTTQGIIGIYFGKENGMLTLDKKITFTTADGVLFYCDINNDYYDDIILSTRYPRQVEIYYGGEEFETKPDIILKGNDPSYFGQYGCNLEDFNGDGKNEIIIDDGTPHNRAKVYTLAEKTEIKNTSRIYNNLLITSSPNPFINNTSISFSLRNPGYITLDIYNILGRRVKSIYHKKMKPGTYDVPWDGKDNNGYFLSNGIYFIRLKTEEGFSIKKLMKIGY